MLGLLLPGIAPARAEPTPSAEYKLKAALIYKLARFVEWPAEDLQESFRICVRGTDPFGAALDVLATRKLYDRPIEIHRSSDAPVDIENCGVLFITKEEAQNVQSLLQRLKKRSVLTIGDAETFARLGGMVQMSLAGKKIRFTVNLQSVEAAGLKVAAPLLELSTVIRPADANKDTDNPQ